jgi:CRP/FNR family transcriptional regulator, cyclic AMP receptor protein
MQQRVLTDLSTQLAARIVELLAASVISGTGSAGQSLSLSQSKLGAMLGKSRQTINKELGKLSERGLIAIDYGKIEVLDLPALEALAGSGSSR